MSALIGRWERRALQKVLAAPRKLQSHRAPSITGRDGFEQAAFARARIHRINERIFPAGTRHQCGFVGGMAITVGVLVYSGEKLSQKGIER